MDLLYVAARDKRYAKKIFAGITTDQAKYDIVGDYGKLINIETGRLCYARRNQGVAGG